MICDECLHEEVCEKKKKYKEKFEELNTDSDFENELKCKNYFSGLRIYYEEGISLVHLSKNAIRLDII